MIPVKIITKEEAVKLGLATNNPGRRSGEGMGAVSTIIKVNGNTGEEIVMEKVKIKGGKKELIFMHPERKEDLKRDKTYTEYVNHFDEIKTGVL